MPRTHEPKRFLARSLSCLLVTALAISVLVIPGCGGGEDNGKSGSSSANPDRLDASREEALAAKKEAEAAEASKYAADKWKTAESHLAKGEDKDNYKYFNRATRAYKLATETAKKNADDLKEVFVFKAEYEKLRDSAKKNGADTLMEEPWALAERSFNSAVTKLESGSKRSKGLMRQAREDMQLIVDESKKKLKSKLRAEQARELAVAGEKAAVEAGAEEHALVDLDFARNSLRDATHRFDDGGYDSAERLFIRAKSNFMFAAENSRLAKAGLAVKQRPPEPIDPDDATLAAGSGSNGDSIGEIPKPTPGPASNGDGIDGDVLSNLDRLFTGSYDTNGQVLKLSYDEDGDSMEKDADIAYGKKGTNVVFKGKEHTATDEYTFAGNERGMLVLRGGFKDRGKLFAEIQFQLWGAESTRFLELLMFWNPRTNSGYALRIGNTGLSAISYKDNNAKSGRPSKYTKDVNRWMNRREPQLFEMRVEPMEGSRSGDKSKNVLKVFFNGEEIIQMKANSHKSGFFGFRWKDAKFYVRNVEFTGVLDEEWAAKQLKGGGGKSDEDGSGGDLDF